MTAVPVPPPGRFEGDEEGSELSQSGTDDRPTAHAVPDVADPMHGLSSLPAVALVGRDRILAAAERPAVYVWRDIAVLGTIVVIAGDPGGGKTTLLFLVIAARIALVGSDPIALLGRDVYPAPAGTYLVLIEGEHSEGSTARKLLRSMRLLDVSDAALCRIVIVARKAVRIGSPEWEDVERMIAAGIVSDIALDTLARVAPADGDNEQAQVAIFDRIAKAIEQAPSGATPTVWVVAHTRKNNAAGELTDVSGSTQRTGQADTVLLSKATREDGRVTSCKVTFAKLREEPDEYPSPVEFAVTRTGIVYADASTAEKDDRPLEARILARLALGPRTRNRLADELGRNKADIQAAIDALFDTRRIQGATIKVRGREFRGLALREAIDTGRDTGRAGTPDDTGRSRDESREGLFYAE